MKPFYESKDSAAQAFEAVNMEFPEHLHDHVEMLFVMEGSILVRIMEKSRELKAGDCAVIFPQQIHSYHTPLESRTRLFIFADSLTGRYQQAVRKCRPERPFLLVGEMPADGVLALDRLYGLSCAGERAQGDRTSAAENAADATDCIEKRESSGGAWAVRPPYPLNMDALCAAWTQLLFALIWPGLAPEKRRRSEGMELTCQVVQYIMEHFQEPLTLEILARELHVNKYYISRIFSDRLKTNFRRYLNHIRLEYAMQLMKASNAPLVDICGEAGFNSQRSFNRAFAEIMGMTPMEYRKSVAGS